MVVRLWVSCAPGFQARVLVPDTSNKSYDVWYLVSGTGPTYSASEWYFPTRYTRYSKCIPGRLVVLVLVSGDWVTLYSTTGTDTDTRYDICLSGFSLSGQEQGWGREILLLCVSGSTCVATRYQNVKHRFLIDRSNYDNSNNNNVDNDIKNNNY